MRDLDQRALGVAVEQQIGLGVEEHRAANLVRPIVVMGDASERRLNSAEDDGRVGISLARPLCVNDRRAIGPPPALAMGRIGVVVPQSAVGCVAVDHRVHIAAGYAEEEIRLAERRKGLGVAPFGLSDNADAKTLRLEEAPDDRHAEARMVDIGVAGDEDHVAAVPAETLHLGARHRQEGRDAEAMRPMLPI